MQPSATPFGARSSLPNGTTVLSLCTIVLQFPFRAERPSGGIAACWGAGQATGAKVVQSQPSVRCSSGGGGSGGGSSGRGGGGGGGGGDSGSGGSLWATYLRLLETQPASNRSTSLFSAVIHVVARTCKHQITAE